MGDTLNRRLAFETFLVTSSLSQACHRPTDAEQPVERLVADTIVPAGSTLFSAPTELTVDGSGHLFVTDWDAATIVVLDSSGSLVRKIGRSGSGPGEFQRPRGARIWGDTLRLLDDGNGRIAVFDLEGTFVRNEPMPPGPARSPSALVRMGRR